MKACDSGHVEVVDKLLQHGADADLQQKVHVAIIMMLLVYMFPLYYDSRMDGVH